MAITIDSSAAVEVAGSKVPALKGLKVVDVDTHLSEPYDLWTKRAPAKFKDRVPQPVIQADGKPLWMIDGNKSLGINCAVSCIRPDGEIVHGMDFTQWQLKDVHPSSYDGMARVEVMDNLGIYASIIYPNLLGFGGEKSMQVDPELRLVSTQIYNDAMAEMQEETNERIFGMALLPWWDIAESVKEVERAKNMGLRGVNLNPSPHNNGFQDLGQACWDPLWEVCSSLDMPINFHIGASDESFSMMSTGTWPSQNDDRQLLLAGANLFMGNVSPLMNILVSGMLERYPNLKFVSVESGIGWIPFMLNALDYQAEHSGATAVSHLSMKPSDYFRRQVYGCFWFEGANLSSVVDQVGADNCLFETDYPHIVCFYPDPLGRLAKDLAPLPPAVQRKIMGENAAKLYNLPF